MTLSEGDFIKESEDRPAQELSQVQKRKLKNQARLERCRAKALAEKLMTSLVETTATTAGLSTSFLEVAEVAAVLAATSKPLADLVGGLKE